ncbi:MAG: insulinase family protein [Epsilonproteobacteria bacterium]|nr:insulinase family protein [Campylobacterota bacterium]
MGSVLPKFYEKTLKNGLKTVVIPINKGSNVITTDIFYKVGSGDEVMGKSGIAHMLEHLNFKSTKHLKAGEFDKIVKSFGGVNNASTGFDYTHYFIKSSSKNLSKSLKLFAELMANLNLKDDEFQTERKVVLEERYWRTDNSPMGYLYFRLFNNAYLYNSYHWTPIGFTDDIKNWTIEDIKAFHKMYYQPKNAIIVVAGDIEPQTVFKESEKYFGAIKNGTDIKRSHQVEPPQDGKKDIMIHKDTQVQMLAIAYHIPDFKNKDQVALSAIGEILSRGKSSRLVKKLVDKKREVNQIFAYNMENKHPGLFLIVAVCNPGIDAKTVKKDILNEIEKIKEGKVTKKELQKIKTNTKADFIYSLESSSSVASLFGSYLARGDIKPLLDYEKNIENLTLDTIKDVANRYFQAKNSTILILKKDEK